MALSRRSRSQSSINIWPGFVDALTQLTMVIVFVLLVFTVGQFYLSGAVSDKDQAIKRLTQQIAELSDMLSLERRSDEDLRANVSQLSQQLRQATIDKDNLTARLAELTGKADVATAQVGEAQQQRGTLETRLAAAENQAAAARRQIDDKQAQISAQEATIALLNQNIEALKRQLNALAAALDLAQDQNKNQQAQIVDLGNKLNLALASKVEELARYRSEFFGRLRQILGDRPDIRVVGDRFVFQSEVLFDQASADLGDSARQQLTPVVNALKEIQGQIPDSINWVLEVDGHTDRRTINTAQFKSNWELSTARAISVVRFLSEQGIPASHLAAAGFAEWQPLDRGTTEEAYRRNRRIELKLTQR